MKKCSMRRLCSGTNRPAEHPHGCSGSTDSELTPSVTLLCRCSLSPLTREPDPARVKVLPSAWDLRTALPLGNTGSTYGTVSVTPKSA